MQEGNMFQLIKDYMMIRNNIVFLLLTVLVVCMLSACNQNSSHSFVDVPSAIETKGTEIFHEDTETTEIIETSETSEINLYPYEFYGCGAEVTDHQGTRGFNGKPITLPYHYEYFASGEIEVGIMVLCDGIQVPFSLDDSEVAFLQKLQCKKTEEGWSKDCTLTFIPYGKEGDKVSIEIVDIINPFCDPEEITSENAMKYMVRGNMGNVRYLGGGDILLYKEGLVNEITLDENCIMNEFTTDELKNAVEVLSDGTVKNNFENFQLLDYQVNGIKSIYYSVNQGDSVDLSFTYCGTSGSSIYTSFYIDNNIFPVFGDCNYSKCLVNDTNKTSVSGKLDTKNLKKGKHLCYAVCGNVDYNQVHPVEAFILEVE